MADTAKLLVQLGLRDGLSGPLGRLQGRLGSFQSGLGRVGTGVGQVGLGLARVGAIAGGAAVIGLAAAARSAIEFEDSFAGVQKTVDDAGAAFGGTLANGIREMARTMPIGTTELNAIAEAAGALGIRGRDNILEFTRVSALLGVTTDVSSDQAATALGQLSNVLNLTGQDYDNFGATLVDLGNKGASTESQILEIASRTGAAAKLLNISTAETLGWSSAVANLGVEVEAGGTAIQQFLLTSLKNVQDNDALTIMAQTAGTTGAAFKRAFAEDASGALQTFLQGLSKLPQAEQLAILDELGLRGVRLQRVVLGLADSYGRNLRQSLLTANEAWRENTALTTESEKRFKTTRSQLTILGNNINDLGITIGASLLPPLAKFSQAIVRMVNENQPAIERFGKEVGAALTRFVADFETGKFDPIIETLKTILGVGKQIASVFLSLPKEVIAALAGFAIANRASGGLIGTGLGNIGRGVLEIAFEKGRSPANPLWVAIAGGGLGGAGGGGRGFWSGAGKIFGISAAAVIGIEIGREIGNFIIGPQVQPQIERERAIFEEQARVSAGDPTRLVHMLEAINDGIRGIAGNTVDPLERLLIPGLADLEAQRDRLSKLLGVAQAQRSAAFANNRLETQLIQETKIGLARAREQAVRAINRFHQRYENLTRLGDNQELVANRSQLHAIQRTNQLTAYATAATRNATNYARNTFHNTGKANAILSQIRAKKTSIQIDNYNTVNATVSAAATYNTVTTYNTVKANTLLGII